MSLACHPFLRSRHLGLHGHLRVLHSGRRFQSGGVPSPHGQHDRDPRDPRVRAGRPDGRRCNTRANVDVLLYSVLNASFAFSINLVISTI